ncbi:cytochrome P450 [Nocardia sp. NPDC052566]|uniref:cytochrome P450 n=1 Tax=Nocardia sp. NPDC052566 TaxID=3364330 RepID=UPI0037C976DA
MMKPQYWFRWVSIQGAPRAVLRRKARRGDVFAQLMGGPQGIADPYSLIERMRPRGPLVRNSLSWATCDYELTRAILRDSRFGVRSHERVNVPKVLKKVASRLTPPANPVDPPAMLAMNPPEHTMMRRPVTSAFTPKAVGRLRDRVETVTEELLAAMPSGGSVDMVEAFASRVPLAIIFEILGFPDRDQEMFRAWGVEMTPLLDIGISWRSFSRAMDAAQKLNDYLDRHIEHLHREPGEDVLSNLIKGGELDDHSIKANASLIIGAGFETTANLISNATAQLLSHPEQLDRLRAEPELWPNAIEEALRIDPSVQTTARTAQDDLELAGFQLNKGDLIVLSLAGANRDPAIFTDPNRFDVARSNAKDHLAFSSGIHVCFGANLARMEAGYALRALFDRFPDMQLAAPPERRPLYTFRGYARMPVQLGRRAHTAV